ncbi:hypothetical protein WJX72_005660 [[Myrmecia] bisecta]|uniref:USP domain-containing protein n=1 Tax=[Myrmecia] bisecta TaxID=41462 RepID=A0AAW1PKA4_9CHLO
MLNLRYSDYKERGWQYWSDPALEVLEAEADAGDFERIQGGSPQERILPKCIQVLKMLRDMEKGPEPTRTSGAHAYLDAFKDSPLLGESKRKRIKAHLAEMAPMREKILREEAMMAKAPDDPEEAGVKASAEDRERRSNKAKEAKSQKEAEQAMAYLQAQLAAAGPQGDVKRAERLRELTHLTWGEIKAAAAPAEMPGVLLEWLADPAGKPWLVYQTALLPGTIYGSATKLLLDLVDAILDEPPMSPRQVKKIVDMQVSPEHRAQLLRQLFAKPVCCWPHDIPSAQQLFRKNPSDFELLLPEGHWKEWRAVMEHAMHWEHEQPEDRKHICSIDNIMISVCDTELPTATTQTMRTVHDYAMAHVMERLTVVCMCNKGIGQEWWVDCGRHSSSQPVLRRGCPEDDPAVREAYANLMVRGALLLWMHQEWSHPEERAPPDCVQRIHTALQAKEITWEGLGPELQQLYVARHAQEPLTAAFIWNPLAASAAPDLDDRSTPRSYETDAGSLTPDSAEHAEHAAHELAADDPAMDSRPLLQEPDLIDLPALRARLQAGNGCASEEPSPTSWGTASYSPDDFDSLALPGVGLQDDDLRSLPSGPSSSSGGRQGDPYDAAGLKPRGVLGPPTDFIGHLHQRAREYILPLEGVQDLQRRLETLRLGQKILLLQRAQQKHMKRPLIETILTILRMLAADGCLTTPLMNAIGRYIFEGLNATSEDFHPPYDISLCDLRLLTLDELAALMEQLLVVVGLHQDSLSWYQTVQNATDLSYRPYKTLGPEGLQLSQQGQAMLAFPPLPVSHDAFHILLSRAASDDAEAQKDSVPACFDATPGWDDTLADEACEREITSCIVGGTLPRWNPGPEASTSGRIDGIGDGVAMEDVADCIQHLVEQALTARVLHHLGQQALLELLRAWQDLRSCEVVPYEGTNSWFQGMFEAYQRLYVGLTDLYEWRLKVRGVEAGNCAQQLLPFHTACQERIKASQRKAEECHQKIKVLDARDAVRAEDLLDEAQRHQNEANQNTHECVRRKFQHASKIHHDATHYLEQYGQGSLPDDFLRDSNGQVDPMLRWLQTCFGQRHTQYSDADVQQVLKKLPNPLFQCEVLHRAEEALGDGMEELDALALQLERLLVPARGLAWKLVVGCREDLSATLMGPIHRALVKKLQDAAVAEQAKQAETAAAELLAASAAEDARAQKAAAAKAAKGKKKSKPHAEDARAQEDAERAAREAAEEAAQQEEEERDREAERLRAEEADAKQHEYDALLVKRAEAAHNHARAAQDQAWKQNLWPDNNGVHLEDVGKEEEFETQRARRARSKQAGASAAAEAGPPAEPPRDSSPFRSDCHRCGKGQAGSYRPGPACYQPLGAAATPTDEEFNKLMNILSSESAASNPAVVGARERSGGAVAQWGGQPAMPVAPGGNKQEDEELQAAIKASLTESQKPRAPTLGKLTVRTQDGPPRQRPLSPEVATPGLQNAAGEYNCFLNVIIQCLWHCTDFRERLMCWGPELVQANPVVAALVGLFHAFAEEESQRHDAARLPDRKRQIVAPTALRAALSALPAQAFRMGEMNDPSEVLLAVYEALKQVRDPHTGAPIGQTLVDGVFGLHVSESVLCRACRKRTQQSGYTQFFYTASATALRMQQIAMPEDRVFGRLLRSIEDNHLKSCDTDVGGCNTSNTVSHELQQPPRVFTLQLAWESQHESGADILATLQTIQEVVDLSTVYAGLPPTAYLYRLHSMVCYYGAHYHAFVQSSKSGQWLMFDDATINVVGSWKDVVSKCQLGKIQPSVLFFTALNT